ncbi:MAG: hypothetical protein MI864_27010 [Pseudomonadales bacterium]|nr:hypothetical protein [Pseudomonadales bacterium]
MKGRQYFKKIVEFISTIPGFDEIHKQQCNEAALLFLCESLEQYPSIALHLDELERLHLPQWQKSLFCVWMGFMLAERLEIPDYALGELFLALCAGDIGVCDAVQNQVLDTNATDQRLPAEDITRAFLSSQKGVCIKVIQLLANGADDNFVDDESAAAASFDASDRLVIVVNEVYNLAFKQFDGPVHARFVAMLLQCHAAYRFRMIYTKCILLLKVESEETNLYTGTAAIDQTIANLEKKRYALHADYLTLLKVVADLKVISPAADEKVVSRIPYFTWLLINSSGVLSPLSTRFEADEYSRDENAQVETTSSLQDINTACYEMGLLQSYLEHFIVFFAREVRQQLLGSPEWSKTGESKEQGSERVVRITDFISQVLDQTNLINDPQGDDEAFNLFTIGSI